MKFKFSLICVMLILVLSIGAVSATDISDENDLNSDIYSSSSIDLTVENDEFDYVLDENMDTNDSSSSQVLGVSENEDLIGDGTFTKIEFRDAVDGVITFKEAEDWSPGSSGNYDNIGFMYNKVYLQVYDENNNKITLNETNSDFSFDGHNWVKEDYDWSPWTEYGDYQYITISDLIDFSDSWDEVDYMSGTYDLIIYNADKTFSQKVTLTLIEPIKFIVTVNIGDKITVNINTNNGPGNFTVYADDEKVINGTVTDEGKGSASFDKRYGSYTLKVVLDGSRENGLVDEREFSLIEGSFTDLNSIISDKNEIDLTRDYSVDSSESSTFKNGIAINKDVTINGNNHIINGTNLVRIFNIANNANVVLKDLIITGALTTSGHGGAIYMASGSLTIENCTFVNNTLRNGGAHGGAIHAADRTTLTIKNSRFEHNIDTPHSSGDSWRPTSNYGGAIYCGNYVNFIVTNTLFKDNAATRGSYNYRNMYDGAISSFGANSFNTITNCTFINNSASNGIGAIEVRVANITGCIFDDNYGTYDYPNVYYSSNGRGIISYNVFLDSGTQIRLRNSFANVVEEYNWYATNEPGNVVRNENTYVAPNKFIMLDVVNEGTTVKAGFMKDSNREDIPNVNALPLRDIALTGDVNENNPKLVGGVATVTYNSEITDESKITATVDGYTVNYTLASGIISNIDVIYVENTTVGDDGAIIIQASGNNGPVDGNIMIYINDTAFESEFKNGIALLNFGSNLNAGIYDIYYEYLGSTKYAPTLKKEKSEYKFEIEMQDVEITYTNDLNQITFTVSHKVMPTGTITVKLGDLTKIFTLNSQGTYTYNFGKELTNGIHDLNITYNGDKNHYSNTLTDTFNIIKHDVSIAYTNDGASFTFSVTSDNGVPTGSISVSLVGPTTVSRNINLNNGAASYNFGTGLHNGTYNLTVTYNGDDNYEVSKFNDTVSISKLSATLVVNPVIIKVIQTNVNFVVTVVGAENGPTPTGTVSYPTDWSSESATLNSEGTASLRWQSWTDPYGQLMNTSKTITYSGDSNYDPATIVVLFQTTPSLSISSTVDGNNVTFSFSGNPNNVGTIYIKQNGKDKGNITVSGYSFQTFKDENLSMGTYNYEFIWDYGNGNNYTFTKSVILRQPGEAQWSVPGFDNKNSGNPDYTRLDNGVILWNATVNNPRSSVVIDSEGNIYIADDSNVRIFNSDGTLKTTSQGGSQGAISLMDDQYIIYVRPWNNIAAFDVGSFAGIGAYDTQVQWYTNSWYAPIIGSDGKIYLSVYFNNGGMPNGGMYLTTLAVDKSSNQFTYLNVMINKQPISSPVIGDDGILWVNTVAGLYSVDTSSNSGSVLSIPNLGIVGRPVIDDASIVYVFGKENTINALNSEGILWNVTVTEGIGSVMAVDNENALLYAVSANGTLYSYNTEEKGAATEIYNIGANATTIMVDGNGNVYVGDSNGMIWAFDSEGNLLWNLALNAPVQTQMAMDKNGIIYVATANTLYALGYRNPIEMEVTIPEGNYNALDEVTITATFNETTEGNVIFTIGDKNITVAIDGTIAELTTIIPGGNQNIIVTFEGNDVYAPVTNSTAVDIAKLDVKLDISSENIILFNDEIITVNVPEGVTGNITFTIGDDSYEIPIEGTIATLNLGKLPVGIYTVIVNYAGSDIFNSASANTTFEITKNVVADVNESTLTLTLTFPDDATGIVLVNINGKGYYGEVKDGKAVISIPNLASGNYTAEVNYLGDENYNAASFEVPVSVPEEEIPEPKDAGLKVSVTNTTITATLNNAATGYIFADVNGIGYYAPVKNGKATINVIGLDAGNYTVAVSYGGDDNYAAAKANALISVPEKDTPSQNVTPADPVDPKADIKVTNKTVDVALPADSTGFVIVDVDGKAYYAPVKDGKVAIDLPELEAGNHTVSIIYTGDSKYQSTTATEVISIEKALETIVSSDLIKIERGSQRFGANFTDAKGNPLVGKNVTFEVSGVTYTRTTNNNGRATIPMNLVPGNYTVKITNPETGEVKTNNITILSRIVETHDVEMFYRNGSQYIVRVLDDNGNPVGANESVNFNINGITYDRKTNKDGYARINLGLAPGDYVVTAEYKGCKASNNIKVKHVLSAVDLTKKFGASDQFKVNLVDGQGKALAGAKVSFNINGVMYERTTNADGVAKMNIKLQAGEYIITSTYNGASISNKVTVTA